MSSDSNTPVSLLSRVTTSVTGLAQDAFCLSTAGMAGEELVSMQGLAVKGIPSRASTSTETAAQGSQSRWNRVSRQTPEDGSQASFRERPEDLRRGSSADLEEQTFLIASDASQLNPVSLNWVNEFTHTRPKSERFEGHVSPIEDGAEVCALLSDPGFSIMTDTTSPFDGVDDHGADSAAPDLFTRDIPPSALSVLETIKNILLPAPPTYQPQSANSPLDLVPSLYDSTSFSSLSSNEEITPNASSDWRTTSRDYVDHVWEDGSLSTSNRIHSRPSKADRPEESGKEMKRADGNGKEPDEPVGPSSDPYQVALSRLVMVFGHVHSSQWHGR